MVYSISNKVMMGHKTDRAGQCDVQKSNVEPGWCSHKVVLNTGMCNILGALLA